MIAPAVIMGSMVALVAALLLLRFSLAYRRLARDRYVQDYAWPAGLLDKLTKRYPGFTRKETALVAQGLRQFFHAHLRSGNRYVAMPSQAADELWHEFILYTRAYAEFCRRAFGSFLHHTPAVALAPTQRASNAGLRRVWWFACKDEGIDPRKPTRVPLLFALDGKLNIPGGYSYVPDCGDLKPGGRAGSQCGADFGSGLYDGGTEGFGADAGGNCGDHGAGDSGDGGGCGGGSGD